MTVRRRHARYINHDKSKSIRKNFVWYMAPLKSA